MNNHARFLINVVIAFIAVSIDAFLLSPRTFIHEIP